MSQAWCATPAIVMTSELRPVMRDPFSLIFGMIQPLVFLALFGPLLVGSLGGQADSALGESVWQWFVPSILVMTALFGTTTVGANLLFEFQTGAHERMLVTPLSRPSLLIGRALKEMVPLAGQAVIIVLVMIPFGFTLYPAGAAAGPAAAGGLRDRPRLAQLRAGDRGAQAGVDVLGRAADADLPADDPVRHAAAAGVRPGVDAGRGEVQPAGLPGRRGARAVRRRDRASATVLWGAVAAVGTAVVGLWVGISAMRRSAE